MRHRFLILLTLSGCAGAGACVSDVVDFQYQGPKIYCYDDWDRADCDINDQEQVNGAGWTFFAGQTCDDRGLVEGSNDA